VRSSKPLIARESCVFFLAIISRKLRLRLHSISDKDAKDGNRCRDDSDFCLGRSEDHETDGGNLNLSVSM
jgi:hypothetical protein